jgi:hypothetical protein
MGEAYVGTWPRKSCMFQVSGFEESHGSACGREADKGLFGSVDE